MVSSTRPHRGHNKKQFRGVLSLRRTFPAVRMTRSYWFLIVTVTNPFSFNDPMFQWEAPAGEGINT